MLPNLEKDEKNVQGPHRAEAFFKEGLWLDVFL